MLCAMIRIALPTLFLWLAACGPADNDPGPGGVTVGEARALDEAAAEIEARSLPDGALPDDILPSVDPPDTTAEQTSDYP